MMDVFLCLVLPFTVSLVKVGDYELEPKSLNLNVYDNVLDYHLQ